MPGVDDQAVDLDHPDQRILVHPAGQRPFGVEAVDLEQVPDRHRLGRPGGLRDPESLVDVGHLHVVRLGGVAEEVHPADDPHDPAGPGLGLASGQRRGPLAGQDARQLPAQGPVLVVEMLPAEGVGQAHDPVVRRAYRCRGRGPAAGRPGPRRPLLGRSVFVPAGRGFSAAGGSDVTIPDRSLASL